MPPKPKPDPFAVAVLRAEEEVTDYLSKVTRLVTYGSYIVLEPDRETLVPASAFMQARALAMMDTFSEKSNADKAKLIGISSPRVTKLRKMPVYEWCQGRVVEIALELEKPQTMTEAAETFEPMLTSQVLGTALFGAGRDRLKAIDEFTGRMSSKKGREAGEISVRLPPQFIELIERASAFAPKAIETTGEVLALPPADAIPKVPDESPDS